MRQAFNNVGILRTDDGAILGVDLGGDFCAEHEMGADPIFKAFGLPSFDAAPLSFTSHLQTRDPGDRLVQLTGTANRKTGRGRQKTHTYDYVFLGLAPNSDTQESWLKGRLDPVCHIPYKMGSMGSELASDLSCCWNHRGFMVWGWTEEGRAALLDLHQAILRRDAVLSGSFRQNAWPEGASGLALTIASRWSPERRAQVDAMYEAERQLKTLSEATGIHNVLRAAGRGHYALAPERTDYFKGLVGFAESPLSYTDHAVVFFLNPHDQRSFRSGWFTVEELEAWARDDGPVLKSVDREAWRAETLRRRSERQMTAPALP